MAPDGPLIFCQLGQGAEEHLCDQALGRQGQRREESEKKVPYAICQSLLSHELG
jgi:hypothetical protein